MGYDVCTCKSSQDLLQDPIFAEVQQFCITCWRNQPFPRLLIGLAFMLICPILVQLNIQLKFIVSKSNVGNFMQQGKPEAVEVISTTLDDL